MIQSQKKRWNNPDTLFKSILFLFSFFILLILAAVTLEMILSSKLSLKQFGVSFLWGKTWDPVQEVFGALPFIYGTLLSSFLGLAIAVPISLGVALFLTELAPSWLKTPISFLIELLAAIPSVIYGLWGIFVLLPFIRTELFPFLNKTLGFLPFFEGPVYGASMMAGGLILSIMILPTITAICREVFSTVPQEMREAVYALGGTRWEAIRWVVLRISRTGMVGACVLGLGRALGETMAVTMVIGNRPEIAASLFAPGYSLSSVIANEFAEATSPLYLSALVEMGLILLGVTFVVNLLAQFLIKRKGAVRL